MKRLRYNLLDDEIEFDECSINILVIESQKYFREFVEQLQRLYDDDSSSLLFTKDYEECKFNKHAQFIRYMSDIDFDSKKIVGKIYQELHKIAVEQYYIKTSEITGEVVEYVQNIIDDSNFDLTYDILDVDTMLKSLHIKVNIEDMNFLEILCKYIEITTNIFTTDIFIFVNLKTYLEKEELLELYNYCRYNKINLLLCENTDREHLDGEKIIILDEDLCQI